LRVGAALGALLDDARLDRWMQDVAARLGVPLPRVALSRAEVSTHRRTDDARREPPPPGYELQLLVGGRLEALGRFFPDRVQTLTRDWDGTEVDGAIPCFNEALWEPVRWVDPGAVGHGRWPRRTWTFDHAVTDWLEHLLRRCVAQVLSQDDVYAHLVRIAGAATAARKAADVESLSHFLDPVWQVVTKLVRERAPLAERDADLLIRLLEIVRESDTLDVVATTRRLREHVGDGLCRAFADAANQLSVLVLVLADERWLEERLMEDRTSFALEPEEARRTAGAVRERFEDVARADHAYPVVVCDDNLRAPLFELLQHYDPRIFVLSYTELSTDVRLPPRGARVVRRFSPAADAP
jgi:hypothetical protein